MKGKQNRTLSGWKAMATRLSMLALIMMILVGCAQATANPPTPQPSEAPTATQPIPATATTAPTAAPTATMEPTALPTATQMPTATSLPALAVLADGFNAWCAPQEYAGTKPTGPDEPNYARKMTVLKDYLQVSIPATYCVLVVRFNQPAPQGAVLNFFNGKSAFLKLPLAPADGKPDEVWASVNHTYVVNPPLWYVVYRLSVAGPDGSELWSKTVRFAKPLPRPCKFGGYPDPVTMYCTPTDPWEIEPKPGVHYPYPRTPVP